jgi:putative peptidoglycan lipid II flippase
MIAFAHPITTVIAGYGAGRNNTQLMAYTLMTLGPGPGAVHRAVLPAPHVLRLRGHPDALLPAVRHRRHQHRAALIGVRVLLDEEHLRFSGVVLGGAYSLAYLVAVLLSRQVLRRRVPKVHGAGVGLPLLAMLIAAVTGAGLARAALLLLASFTDWEGPLTSLAELAMAALVMLPVYVGVARVLRIHEVNDVVGMVTARLPGRPRRS